MLAEYWPFQSVRTLQHDGIVVGGVYLCVADGEVFTAVDVDAVAVGIDGHIVDSTDVTACCDNGKMPTAIDGDVADGYVMAKFQGYGLVARSDASPLHIACFLRISFGQSLTVYYAVTCDADILLTLSPDE